MAELEGDGSHYHEQPLTTMKPQKNPYINGQPLAPQQEQPYYYGQQPPREPAVFEQQTPKYHAQQSAQQQPYCRPQNEATPIVQQPQNMEGNVGTEGINTSTPKKRDWIAISTSDDDYDDGHDYINNGGTNVVIIFLICMCSTIYFGGIALAFGFGGYGAVLSGMDEEEYAATFNIPGQCECTNEYTTSSTSCCGHGGNRRCTTHYTTHYTWRLIDNYNDSMPCDVGQMFESEESGQGTHFSGDTTTCYTNEHCAEIFPSLHNNHHALSGWIYFVASLLFVIGCCYGGCCLMAFYNHSVGIYSKCCGYTDAEVIGCQTEFIPFCGCCVAYCCGCNKDAY